jgi:lipopolysaccharide transport system ATP-binding protein
MNYPYIKLSGINLHYSSGAYQDKSLKKYLFEVIVRKGTFLLGDIHALKNIDLEIKQGEKVALIGNNGAGKSTLLKTIAKVYPVSSGQLIVAGRVRALFELSLGFEPDATGRENIVYRSLLLGKKPREITKITEDIINFADLGKFIDYPVKTYSAGMLVRLAFSISTSIEGEILLLDEVIAAGDAGFVERAKQRINGLVRNAEILILASHDFASIKNICNRVIVLEHGNLLFDGNVDDGIHFYKQQLIKQMDEQQSHEKKNIMVNESYINT